MIEQLQDMKTRVEAATPGPWSALLGKDWLICTDDCDVAVGPEDNAENAVFIAEARTDVPKLIAALEAVLEMTSNPGDVVGWHGAPDDLVNFAYSIQSTITEALA